MSRSVLAAFVVLAALAPAAHADILMPGTKWVSHKVRFENLKDFPEYTFFLKNVGWRGQNLDKDGKDKDADTRRLDLQPFAPDGEGHLGGNPIDGPKWLFAISKKLLPDPAEKPLEKWFTGDHEGVLKVELMRGRRAAPANERRDTFWTVYRIGIADGKMSATVVSEDQPGAIMNDEEGAAAESDEVPQRLLIGGAVFVVALALGLFVYFRRKG